MVDDDTDSASGARSSPSDSHTSHTSVQSDYAPPAKRLRMNSYNLRASGTWKENGSVEKSSRRKSKGVGAYEHPISSSIRRTHNGVAEQKTDILSSTDPKSDLLNLMKYPWDNDPIAMAIWIAQKIDSFSESRQNSSVVEYDRAQSNTPTRPAIRRSFNRNNRASFPRRGDNGARSFSETLGRLANSGMIQEPAGKHEKGIGATMDRKQVNGKQSPSADSLSAYSFHHLMTLQAERIAPKLAKLPRFKPGFGDKLFNKMANELCQDVDVVAAGKLIASVLGALLCPARQSKCQAATDALITVLDEETSQSPRFTKAFTILSNDPSVAEAARIISTQINSSELLLGFDGEFNANGGLSSCDSPDTTHSPHHVDEQLCVATRALENHLKDPLSHPSPPSYFSPTPSPSSEFQAEHSRTNIASLFTHTQDTAMDNSSSASIAPRHSSRIRKPTARALEADLSALGRGRRRARSTAPAAQETTAMTSQEPVSGNAGMQSTQAGLETIIEAPGAYIAAPTAPAPTGGRQRTQTGIAASSGVNRYMGPPPPALAPGRDRVPRRLRRLPSPIARPAPPPLTSEEDKMVEEFLGVAFAAVEDDFKPDVEIDMHRARRDWYAEQLARSIKEASEKTAPANAGKERETAPTNEGTAVGETAPEADVTAADAAAPASSTTTEHAAAPPALAALVDAASAAAAEINSPDVATPTPSSSQVSEAAVSRDANRESTAERLVSEADTELTAPADANDTGKENLLDPSDLSHSYMPRPWTDSDGWVHTGRGNQHNEEIVEVPANYVWVRPTDTFHDARIPVSPPQLKSIDQIERDDAFGYPPAGRQPNLPQEIEGPFVPEDVEAETEKAKVFHAARDRGIKFDRSMPLEDIRFAIEKFNEVVSEGAAEESSETSDAKNLALSKGKFPASSSKGPGKRARASKKRTAGEALEDAAVKNESDTAPASKPSGEKKRRKNTDAPTAETDSAATQAMDVDVPPTTPPSRGPGRPSRRAAATAAASRMARDPPKPRRKRQAPASSANPAEGIIADPPVHNNPTQTAAGDDAGAAMPSQAEQNAVSKE
ncbi:hypothetical protein FQN50_007162 [Emmonsiellopsis sp. PD_5]|nr:hypothetical protein FQN50_007162 [Emmonsiellopsis sp. PD_5]